MSYAQVAQHHKDNAQKEKHRNEKQANEQVVASSNGKHTPSSVATVNATSGRGSNDSRDLRGKCLFVCNLCLFISPRCMSSKFCYNVTVMWL